MNRTFIFGHKNPDTDSITSAIVLAMMEPRFGGNAVACRLGEINKETKYVLDYFNVPAPILIVDSLDKDDNVMLVDHNDFSQSADGIEKVNIVRVIDHHCINNFRTTEPISYIAEPVGCTRYYFISIM